MIPPRYPVLMPDTPSEIVTEIGRSPACRRLKRELITGARFQQEYMILRQQRINEANKILESRVMEGSVRRIAEYDQEFHFQMMLEHGADCWSDPEFLEDTLRKNPGMRIRVHLPTRISVDGFRDKSISKESASGTRATDEVHRINTVPERVRDGLPAKVRPIEHSLVPFPPQAEEETAA